jgi:hypothetical protein
MRPRKPGKKPHNVRQQKAPSKTCPSGVPPWPRVDLTPPELMLGALRDCGRVVLISGYLTDADRPVVKRAVQQLRRAEAKLLILPWASEFAQPKAIFAEHATFFGAVCTLAAGERPLVEGDVGDEIEGVECFSVGHGLLQNG